MQVAAAAVATSARLARGAASQAELAALLGDLAELWQENVLKRLREWSRGKWTAKSEQQAVLGAAEPVEAAARALHSLLRHALAIDMELLALVHRALAPLLESAVRRLREVGAESFDGLLRKTRDLLVARPDVAERVRRDIDQLLVDEFQDTDALQCEIVAVLALGGDTAARPGLFLVGDPKQSVYGWRNADIGAYMDFVARVLAEPGAVQHGLCVNYRSVPAVLDEVERVIEPAMHFAHGLQPPFERLLPCERHAGVVGSGKPELAGRRVLGFGDLGCGGTRARSADFRPASRAARSATPGARAEPICTRRGRSRGRTSRCCSAAPAISTST